MSRHLGNNGHGRKSIPARVRPRFRPSRRGAVLVLVVMLLFAFLAIAGLLIDVGMARLTQAHMQSVSDAAAIEGGWQMCMGADDATTRDAVVKRAETMSESWGSKRIELSGGYDLEYNGDFESAQTIDLETLGDPVRPTLDRNLDNAPAGDVVFGVYDENLVPSELPGQPLTYDRGPAFVPDLVDANSILVRLRRTRENEIPGGTSAEPLQYLWSRGSLMDLSLKGFGIAVRSDSIVNLVPAVSVGDDADGSLPTALNAAIPLSEVTGGTLRRDSLMVPDDPRVIGSPVSGTESGVLTGTGYLPIASQLTSGQWQVIGFLFAEVTSTEVIPSTLVEQGFEIPNVTANLNGIENLSDELLSANQSLADLPVALAPSLVRSRQIQRGTP